MVWGLALALAIRLVLIPWFSDPLNFYGYHLAGSFIEGGGNPWRLIVSDPALFKLNPWGYPPLYLLPVLFASLLSFGNGYLFGLWIRLPLVAADLCTGILLFRTGRAFGLSQRNACVVAYGYLFNPFAILVCAVWGTNDPLPVAFTMGAVYYLVRKPSNAGLSSVLLGIGIALKLYPFIFLPIFVAGLKGWRTRLWYLGIAFGTPLVTAAPTLAASPLELAETLGSFSTGITPRGFGPALSFWWVLADSGIRVDQGAVLAAGLAFFVAVVLLAWATARGQLTVLRGSTIVILGLFAVAPRLNQNYFLWSIPFILLVGSVESWPSWGRRIAWWSWVPLLASGLLYNGWGGVIGLSYWMLISAGRNGLTFGVFPSWVLRVLLAVFLGLLILALASLVIRGRPATHDVPSEVRNPARQIVPAVTRQAAVVVVVAMGIFLATSVAVAYTHRPVWPEDFGSYSVTQNEIVVRDDFHALLLRFDWRLGGTGSLRLGSGGPYHLILDTLGANGTSWFERDVPDRPVRITLWLVALRLDSSPGILILSKVPGGWLGIETPSPGVHDLFYFDQVRNQTSGLGVVELGSLLDFTIQVSANRTEIDFNGSTVMASGSTHIERIQVGHTNSMSDGGGQIAVQSIELSWSSDSGSLASALGPATAVLGAGALGAPIAVRRRENSGKS